MIQSEFAKDERLALPDTEAGWVDLLRVLPRYDPFAAADDFEFDDVAAIKRVGFIEEKLHHIEGPKANQPFILQRWQQSLVCNTFGWKVKRTGKRRFLEVFVFVPRKNGKTPLAAALVLCVLVCDGEVGAQINGYAEDRDQAEYVYRQAKGMVERDAELRGVLTIYKGKGDRRIVFEDLGSVYKIMPADEAGAHGGNLHMGVVDELHAQKNPDLLDIIESSFGAREEPLLVCCTTSDYDKPSICNEKHAYATDVLNDPAIDPRFLPVIYELPKGTKWNDRSAWAACNPNLGVSISREYLERACKKAERVPRRQNAFRRHHCNERTQQATRWLDLGVWDENAGTINDETLLGLPCVVGIDLSSTQDITATCKVWRITPEHDIKVNGDGEQRPQSVYVMRWQFWVPASCIEAKDKKDQARYREWIDAGWIEEHTEDVVDYDRVERAILKDDRDYGIVGVYIDPHNATQLSLRLRDTHGIPVKFFRQGIKQMNPACKTLERLLLLRQCAHGRNPVARWMAGNCAVMTDDTDNIKLTKLRSFGRIDGIVAAVQALYVASTSDDPGEGPTVTWL